MPTPIAHIVTTIGQRKPLAFVQRFEENGKPVDDARMIEILGKDRWKSTLEECTARAIETLKGNHAPTEVSQPVYAESAADLERLHTEENVARLQKLVAQGGSAAERNKKDLDRARAYLAGLPRVQ